MKKRVSVLFCLSIVLILLPLAAVRAQASDPPAANYVNYDIENDTRWLSGSTYVICYKGGSINDPITVKPGATLTIELGAKVYFGYDHGAIEGSGVSYYPHSYMIVEGALDVGVEPLDPDAGTENVLFSSLSKDGAPLKWSGIRIQPSADGQAGDALTATASFNCCTFEHGGTGAENYYGMITIDDNTRDEPQSVNLTLTNCVFQSAALYTPSTETITKRGNAIGVRFGLSSGTQGSVTISAANCDFGLDGAIGNALVVAHGTDDYDGLSAEFTDCRFGACCAAVDSLGSNGDIISVSDGLANADSVSLSGCTFSGNGYHGTLALSGAKSVAISGCSFTCEAITPPENSPIVLNAGSNISCTVQNTFAGTGFTGNNGCILLKTGSNSANAAEWPQLGRPYLVTSAYAKIGDTDAPVPLTIHEGVTVNFLKTDEVYDPSVSVYGDLTALGTVDKPITFLGLSEKEGVLSVSSSKEGACVSLSHCRFDSAGGLNIGGLGSFKTVTVENCEFENCGGGVSTSLEGSESGASFRMTNCAFRGNDSATSIQASDGQAMQIKIRDCVFTGGANDGLVFGASVSGANIDITNCLIAKNAKRGVVYSGSAQGITAALNSCTIANNGETGFYYNAYYSYPAVQLNSCIVWGNNTTDNHQYCDIDDSYSYSGKIACVSSCIGTSKKNISYVAPAEDGCIYTDPLFIDAPNGDYGLADGSPCIGTGKDGLDMGYMNSPSGFGRIRAAANGALSVILCNSTAETQAGEFFAVAYNENGRMTALIGRNVSLLAGEITVLQWEAPADYHSVKGFFIDGQSFSPFVNFVER